MASGADTERVAAPQRQRGNRRYRADAERLAGIAQYASVDTSSDPPPDLKAPDRAGSGCGMSGAAISPPVVVLNFVPIAANGILARFDLRVTKWRVTLRRCLWRQEGARQWVELPCKAIDFDNRRDHEIFQRMALDALRHAAEQQ